MAPSAIVDAPVHNKTVQSVVLPLEIETRPSAALAANYAGRLFKDSLLEDNRVKSSSKTLDLLVALTLHVVVLSIPIFLGLYFTQTINLKEFTSTMLVAPPPPPPPPPAPAAALLKPQAVKRVFVSNGKLLAPTVIPKEIANIKEAPLAPDAADGVVGGVPGGVPGGQLGGVIGGVIGGIGPTRNAAAPPPPVKRIVRVGGRVRPPRPIQKVMPIYPTLARISHITGDVVIDAVLDEQGNVTEMKIVSGPPLLYEAALTALSKWKYEPTYLNDEPVSVELIVTISFQLNQ
jgi:protein TonB